ncbi:capsular exopolysaccharide synthesis family protein [Motilibacter rhizosphaerae]|uniref:Capsular exopolysaccharide synthesis family protein n=1 Tax=Motilibacter rhizosphaerae TaxID=598652 RepID=A0A4Q7NPZ8_9ACTN|nr:polysaccharide biosynthesis tyrosine autokinase [Motilibacter rhizosphaerae]RZS87404.1 capsular exopolysaccharide synthesis family protein [Motilibacter rhizosphaerae]
MSLSSYLGVVRRRWGYVLIALLVCVPLGVLAHERAVPVYSSTAQVLLLPNDLSERGVSSDTGDTTDPVRYQAGQLSVMMSPQVVSAAARDAGLPVNDLRRHLSVVADDSADTVEITVTSTDALKATDAANAVGRAYIQYNKTQAQQSLQTAADGIGRELDTLSTQITALQNASKGTANSAALQAAIAQYTALFSKQQDLTIDAGMKKGGAQLVGPADGPGSPTGLSLKTEIVLAALFGLVLGLGAAFLREQLDDRLRSREELEDILGVPVLGEIPRDRKTAKRERYVAALADSSGTFAEATRALRTNITFLGIEQPVSKLLVTSAMPGEGKTVTAANLALTFAQAGLRTVVVSGDLRRPRLEALFAGTAPSPGLSGVLALRLTAGSDSARREQLASAVGSAVVATRQEGLSLLPAGACPPNPVELLGSGRMDDVLALLEERFDVIVIDASPLLAVTDAAVLAPKVGNVLLVASMTSSRRRALARLSTVVAPIPARVLGVVANKARLEKGSFAPYYEDRSTRQRASDDARSSARPEPQTVEQRTVEALAHDHRVVDHRTADHRPAGQHDLDPGSGDAAGQRGSAPSPTGG